MPLPVAPIPYQAVKTGGRAVVRIVHHIASSPAHAEAGHRSRAIAGVAVLRNEEVRISPAAADAGAKACGGPERYLAWSNKSNDGKQLTALARAQAEASRKLQQSDGMMSTCAIVTDPGATCEAGRCVLNKGDTTAM